MDKYLNREFNQDADQNPESSIEQPCSPAPMFSTPGSHFTQNPFPRPEKPTLIATPPVLPESWALLPPVDKASPRATDIDASNFRNATPPLRATGEIEEDDFSRNYSLAPYPLSPEFHPTSPVITTVASKPNLEPQSSLLAVQTPVSCWDLARFTDSEVTSTPSGQQAEQDQQQLPQQEAHQYSNTHYAEWATQTPSSQQSPGQFPVYSPHRQASVFVAAATMDQATQTQTPRPATAATAGHTPAPSLSGSIPPEQPAPSVHSTAAPPPPPQQQQQQPPPPSHPPTIPSYPHPYQPLYAGLTAPYAMAQFNTAPPYFYCQPGASPGAGFLYSNWNKQSPWYSGTSHYLTSPRPQVYTVEPAFIMPQQATYYQPASPIVPPYYYYVPGGPSYYCT
ncbi:hypothetical protein FHL15_003943 [Xylaria flabelliformis]|uniref:Uncharacterized protein n=1 Tax=Xylaria flabelliformis TaxID=2512241 RepID=A0A553I4X0_9PEZI|nr:hypothetical protein FHL15_003943 [Xylaria flabelliformis]